MSSVTPVTSANDSGRGRKFWSRLIYRQDGAKRTINAKQMLAGITGAFILSTMLVMVKGPNNLTAKDPIEFDEAAQGAAVEIPEARMQSYGARGAKRASAPRAFSGLQVVNRSTAIQVPPGSVVKARLVSGASNGPVKAVLIEDLSSAGETLLPSGTSMVGVGSSTEDRLMIDFSKAVLRDGSIQGIHGQACDGEDQVVGLKGSKVSRFGAQLAAGIGLNFAGGLAQGLQETTVINGVATRKADLRNAALNGAATASIEQSKEVLEKWKSQKAVIEVKRGTEICVIFAGD